VTSAHDTSFASKLLQWYDVHGRKDLPWQHPRTPYRVWVSEIMLQQTQVAAVVPFFARFTEAFPDIESLAQAPLDRVLHLWSGLGYYARARHLHAAAKRIIEAFDGEMPSNPEELMALPGIGRSTAAAIASIAFGQPAAILDGNVKRVLARVHAIDGWPGNGPVARKLWTLAERAVSHERPADYTQAIMDLGATLCTRVNPACEACPLKVDCIAYGRGAVARYPASRPKRALPTRRTRMLLVVNRTGDVLLERRPPAGVWGGLWCFPEADAEAPLDVVFEGEWLEPERHDAWECVTHTFTHFRLEIEPIVVRLRVENPQIMEGRQRLWYKGGDGREIGLAAPVKRLLPKVSPVEALL
jgi:A/G-specific adenine glycosylase